MFASIYLFVRFLLRPRSIEAISNGTIPRNGRNGATTNGGGVLNGGGHLMNGGNCVTRGAGGLHEDADFPPNPKTLSRRKPIVWLRPHVSLCLLQAFVVVYLCLDGGESRPPSPITHMRAMLK